MSKPKMTTHKWASNPDWVAHDGPYAHAWSTTSHGWSVCPPMHHKAVFMGLEEWQAIQMCAQGHCESAFKYATDEDSVVGILTMAEAMKS